MKKLNLRGVCWLSTLVVALAVGICVQGAPAVPDLPSDQQVLAFLTDSIDWYRHRAAEEQVATEPADLVFLEDNRSIARQVVQLSFDFARADASLAATFQAANRRTSAAIASSSSAELAHFAALQDKVDLASQQAQQELETIQKKLVPAHGAERRTLQAALDVTQRRLILLQAELASLRDLVDFVQVTAGRQDDLASSIEDLARTMPELTSPAAVRSSTQNPVPVSSGKPQDSGILGLSSEVSKRRIRASFRICPRERTGYEK